MKKIVMSLILTICFIAIVNSATVEIVIKEKFEAGEKVSFDYTIISPISQNVTYVTGINCFKSSNSLLESKKTELKSNVPFTKTHTDFTIDESIEPQACAAYVQILKPLQQTFSKNFTISTLPNFDFKLKLDKKVFVKNENIRLDYESEVEIPSISATLTPPSGKPEKIELPASIIASQIGTYELEVAASKEGYKTAIKTEQFGVIEKNAEIQDWLAPKESEGSKKSNALLGVSLIVLVILVVVLLLYVRYKRNLIKG